MSVFVEDDDEVKKGEARRGQFAAAAG